METKVGGDVVAFVGLGSTQTASWRGRKRIGVRRAWDMFFNAQSVAKLFAIEACKHRDLGTNPFDLNSAEPLSHLTLYCRSRVVAPPDCIPGPKT